MYDNVFGYRLIALRLDEQVVRSALKYLITYPRIVKRYRRLAAEDDVLRAADGVGRVRANHLPGDERFTRRFRKSSNSRSLRLERQI